MNANPAYCDCERCEIDRERAPYQRAWLTAFREATTAQVSAALDAVENGSHRDSPAANGALLALTGLMLEKESELSGAVVGGAAGQQDQGEQSPRAAAEMERRIGLMGRLNDAAARLRRVRQRHEHLLSSPPTLPDVVLDYGVLTGEPGHLMAALCNAPL